ncbi:di-heme oxidoredictase family protein [Anaeromyxobacter oryzae]|uniref:Cytochrome c domain-containing protein n=1 Tax=Anaeromyxobacter oryzae TaxID=2918170 RepID=A0ABN6MX81_9BACT|nr:di-heme oxidoredictase family protein [Anaeromyxobacter oryzae]BDG05597.1 hypothetical protein AMOR_45930 [Anaeromyxobacter oryzae]
MGSRARITMVSLGALASVGAIDAAASAPDPESFSAPLPGLDAEQRARFEAGRAQFETREGIADGLGPIFNGVSGGETPAVACASCHDVGGAGGGSDLFETRFGRRLDGGGFDPLAALGGTLLQAFAIPGFDAEKVPAEADVTARRRSIPLFGLGLVDAVPDETFHSIAAAQREKTPETAGRVSIATSRANRQPAVAKFGWKAQIQSLLEFAGSAYVNEMGITSSAFPVENCPGAAPGTCDDGVADPEDDGTDVARFRDFMTFLAPPPRGRITPGAVRGEAAFERVGCADCHVPTLTTGSSRFAALDNKAFHPYSDFLLHDMGSLGDGIGGAQADASGIEAVATRNEMRTQPLWGLRLVDRYLHDGRATTLPDAIAAHDGQAATARRRFFELGPDEQEDVVAFLKSL